MNQAMISACIVMMAFGTACRISLDPIGGAGGAGSSGAAGSAGGTGTAGATVGDVVFPRAAVPLWSRAVPSADINDRWPSNPVVAADGLGNTVVFTVEPGTPLDSFDSNGNHRWSKTFGGAFVSPHGVAVNRSGLIAITGVTRVGLDFGGGLHEVPEGYYHAVVGVFNDAGNHIWSNVFSSNGGAGSSAIGHHIGLDVDGNVILIGSHDGAVDLGGVVLPAYEDTSTDDFIAKLDPTGHPLWAKNHPWNAGIVGMATDASGNIVVAGNFHGTVNFGGGKRVSSCTDGTCDDVFVVKFDASGAYVWDRTFPSGPSTVNGVAVDGSGSIALTGTFWDDLDLGDVRLESRGGVEHDADGDGAAPFPAPGGDIFVMKLDPEGDLLWARRFGDDKDQSATSVAMTEGGDIALTGYMAGRLDIGADTMDCALPHAFVTKLDAAGNALWVAHSCASLSGQGRAGTSVTTDGSDNVIAAGLFADTIDFGTGPLTQPEEDSLLHGFLVKFAP